MRVLVALGTMALAALLAAVLLFGGRGEGCGVDVYKLGTGIEVQGPWEGHGTRTRMIEVLRLSGSQPPAVLIRGWLFSPEERVGEGQFRIVIESCKGAVEIDLRTYRKGMYIYTETVLVACHGQCSLVVDGEKIPL